MNKLGVSFRVNKMTNSILELIDKIMTRKTQPVNAPVDEGCAL